jgi:arylsulfatase A-like enzyme
MKRRKFLKSFCYGSLSIGITGQLKIQGQSFKRKPNIIYILADDAGIADFGCYGGTKINTPFVDQLAKEGLKFTQHYSGSTVCAPSRSCLMTGQHTGHTTVRGNKKIPLTAEDVTVAQIMKKAGYITACIGKWGLGENESSGQPNKKGFDFFYGYLNQGRAHRYYPDYLWRNDQKEYFPNNPTQRTHYCHDLFTQEALEFIKQNKEKPFFLYLPYTIPHVDLDVPEDSMKPYYGKFGQETAFKGNGYRGHPTPRACFAGMVSRMDRDIGQIMDLIKKLDLEKDTLIMFSSDNGATPAGGADPEFFKGNGPYRGIKRDLYEGGIRAPMIARWPGKIKTGMITDHISAFWDILPTLADLTGQPVPENIDGISMLPTLLGQSGKQKQHTYLYWEFYERGGKQAIRKEDWKAVRTNINKNPNGKLELYNLKKDVSEKTDVAEKYPNVINELNQLMKEARTESDHFKFGTK